MKYFWFNSPTQLLILWMDRQTGDGCLAVPGPLSEHSPVPRDWNKPWQSPSCPGTGPCRRCLPGAVVVHAAHAAVADAAVVGARRSVCLTAVTHRPVLLALLGRCSVGTGRQGRSRLSGAAAQPLTPISPHRTPRPPPRLPGLTRSGFRGAPLRRSEKSMAVSGRGTTPGGGGGGEGGGVR